MTPAEVEAIEQAIQNGVEATFMHLLSAASIQRSRERLAVAEAIERAFRAGLEEAVENCLVNPFPRRGAPRAVLGNARPRIRSAIEEELDDLRG